MKKDNKIKIFFSKKKNILICLVILLLVILTSIGGAVIYNNSKDNQKANTSGSKKEDIIKETKQEDNIELVLKEVKLNKGSNLDNIEWITFIESPKEFTDEQKTKFESLNLEGIDFNKAGEYIYSIKFDKKLYTGKVIISEEKIEETIKEDVKVTTSTKSETSSNTSNNTSTTTNNSGSSTNTSNSTPSQNTQTPQTPTEPVVQFHIPAGTYSSNGGTFVADGNGNGTLKFLGAQASTKEFCENQDGIYNCSIKINQNNPGRDIAFVSFGDGNVLFNDGTIGNYNTYSNKVSISVTSGTKSLSSWASPFEMENGATITSISTFRDSNQLASKVDNYIFNNGLTGKVTKIYTYDSNFKLNGAIVIEGTKKAGWTGLDTVDSYTYKQLFF